MAAAQQSKKPEPVPAAAAPDWPSLERAKFDQSPPVPAERAPDWPSLVSDDEDVMDDIGSVRNLIKKLREEVNELKDKKYRDHIDSINGQGSHNNNIFEDNTRIQKIIHNHNVFEDGHIMEESIWSAVLLLAGRREDGKRLLCVWDRGTIIIFSMLAMALQMILVLTVHLNMVDGQDPYNQDTIAQFLDWRIWTGHSAEKVDVLTGESFMERLCSEKMWTWEASEYATVNTYNRQPMPGSLLGLLALTAWTLTCFLEYRSTVDHLRGIIHLPIVKWGEQTIVEEDGSVRFVGMSKVGKSALLLCVCVPRIAIFCYLYCVGAVWICRTADLSDLILNAIALAFVLDMDELLYAVILSRKVQSMVSNAAPLPLGKVRYLPGGCPVNDGVRLVFITGCIIFFTFFTLLPFATTVDSADQALCGGSTLFNWHQEDPAQPMVVLDHTTKLVANCDADGQFENYVKEQYPYYGKDMMNNTKAKNKTNGRNRGRQIGLDYAFKDSTGLTPSMVAALASFNATPGQGAKGAPAACPLFNASFGEYACGDLLPDDSACVMTAEDRWCAGLPGGDGPMHRAACFTPPKNWNLIDDDYYEDQRGLYCGLWTLAQPPQPNPNDDNQICTIAKVIGNIRAQVADCAAVTSTAGIEALRAAFTESVKDGIYWVKGQDGKMVGQPTPLPMDLINFSIPVQTAQGKPSVQCDADQDSAEQAQWNKERGWNMAIKYEITAPKNYGKHKLLEMHFPSLQNTLTAKLQNIALKIVTAQTKGAESSLLEKAVTTCGESTDFNGNKNGDTCVFPFFYDGAEYNSCKPMTLGSTTYTWCVTVESAMGQKQGGLPFGICQDIPGQCKARGFASDDDSDGAGGADNDHDGSGGRLLAGATSDTMEQLQDLRQKVANFELRQKTVYLQQKAADVELAELRVLLKALL